MSNFFSPNIHIPFISLVNLIPISHGVFQMDTKIFYKNVKSEYCNSIGRYSRYLVVFKTNGNM